MNIIVTMNIFNIIEKEKHKFFYHRFKNNKCKICGVERQVGNGVWISVKEKCPTYNISAKIIQKAYNLFKLSKKMPTLWKIAEYYTSIKYNPKNIENIFMRF